MAKVLLLIVRLAFTMRIDLWLVATWVLVYLPGLEKW